MFFVPSVNNHLNKQGNCRWFETSQRSYDYTLMSQWHKKENINPALQAPCKMKRRHLHCLWNSNMAAWFLPGTWWRLQMETFSALLAICAGNSPGTGEFPAQRPVTRSFDVFFDLRLNKRLSKQSWGWRFETLSRSLWRHRNGMNPFGNVTAWPDWTEVIVIILGITE